MIGRAIILVATLAGLTLHAFAQSPSPSRPDSMDESDVVRIHTRLVTVPVSVRGRDGSYVTSLRREDFRIYEDGVEQSVAHFETVSQPIEIILLLDYSVSIRADLKDIREIAADFLDRVRPEDRVRVVAFGQDISVLRGDSHDRESLRRSILSALMTGATALYDAVLFTFRHMVRPGGGRKTIILFTDGKDNSSHQGSYEQSLAYAEEPDAVVHVVKYGNLPNTETGPERDGRLYLQELAEKTGGRFYFAGGHNSMLAALSSIAEELRSQYSMGYYPSAAARPGKRRKIKVRVNRSNVAVRARDSYTIRTKEQ